MSAPPRKITVTDHGLLRYIERAYGVDLEKVRDEIADKVKAAVGVGAASLSQQGLTFILDYTSGVAWVKTVVPNQSAAAARLRAKITKGVTPRRHADSKSEYHKRVRRGDAY